MPVKILTSFFLPHLWDFKCVLRTLLKLRRLWHIVNHARCRGCHLLSQAHLSSGLRIQQLSLLIRSQSHKISKNHNFSSSYFRLETKHIFIVFSAAKSHLQSHCWVFTKLLFWSLGWISSIYGSETRLVSWTSIVLAESFGQHFLKFPYIKYGRASAFTYQLTGGINCMHPTTTKCE